MKGSSGWFTNENPGRVRVGVPSEEVEAEEEEEVVGGREWRRCQVRESGLRISGGVRKKPALFFCKHVRECPERCSVRRFRMERGCMESSVRDVLQGAKMSVGSGGGWSVGGGVF